MYSHWQLHNPVKMNFGCGVRSKVVENIKGLRCLIVTSKRGRLQFETDEVLSLIFKTNDVYWIDNISPNPGIDELQIFLDEINSDSVDLVIGFGGGSALDAAKVLAVALSPDCRNEKVIDLISKQVRVATPLYTIPTTSGTGSEVTPFATVWDHSNKKKLSLAGPHVFPLEAYVDPELTLSLPRDTTIYTGLDAINQAAESIWNKNANSITLDYAMRALMLGLNTLPQISEEKFTIAHRIKMSECSLLSGIAISQTRTALCHSISYPLTAHYDVPHGLACAFTMPAVLQFNLIADDGRFSALKKYLGIDDLQKTFDQLNHKLEVNTRVKKYIDSFDSLMKLEPEMLSPGRADNNIRNISRDELVEILQLAWQ